ISEAESEAVEPSTVEPLPEILHEKQHQISEETSPELLEIMPESAPTLIKTKTSEPLSGTDSDVYEKEEEKCPSTERQTRSVKFGMWNSHLEGKASPLDSVQEIKTSSENYVSREHIRKKLRMERMVLKRMRTPKRAKRISVPKIEYFQVLRDQEKSHIPPMLAHPSQLCLLVRSDILKLD
ncbi:hypothetical protein JD844_012883, partial [Phrynosoma platyrhinos]